MSLISILISLAVETFWEPIEQWRQFAWYERFCNWVTQKLGASRWFEGPIGVLAMVLPVVLGVWLAYGLLDYLGSLLGFIFSVVVLIFSLGPRDLFKQVTMLTNALGREDIQAAQDEASELLGSPVEQLDADTAQQVKETILVKVNDNFMGVFFWFVILGPVGAALFRLSCLTRERMQGADDPLARASGDLYRILSWPSARLSVLGFAIAGNFVDSMNYWRDFADLWKRESRSLLIASGLGALGHDETSQGSADAPAAEQFQQALELVKRTIITWVTLLALMTIAGWLT